MQEQKPSRSRFNAAQDEGITVTALMMSGCIVPFGAGDTTSSSRDALQGIDSARAGVVRIVAQGSYVDPAEGLISSAGSGSGFIIDPEGHVVTNAHVVEGAGLIRVYLDDDEPVTARILGVSECNDLAVCDPQCVGTGCRGDPH
jgi:serine protease Do